MSGLALWVGVGALGGVASIARFAVHGLFPAGLRRAASRSARWR